MFAQVEKELEFTIFSLPVPYSINNNSARFLYYSNDPIVFPTSFLRIRNHKDY